jgi:LysM repeat protein
MNPLMDAFNDCVDRIASGDSLENCLKAYPEHAKELRPMLESARLIKMAAFHPSEIRAAQDRVRFRLQYALKQPPKSYRWWGFQQAVALILVIGFIIGITGTASQSTLPGDRLYNFKRLTEKAQVFLSANDDSLHRQQAQERVEEIRQLVALGRAAEVSFEGEIQQIQSDVWVVSGLFLQVPSELVALDQLTVGAKIKVEARTTTNGQLIAVAIEAIDSLIVEPLPTPTSKPSPTQQASPTATPRLTATPRSTATPTATPTVLPLACLPQQPEGWVLYRVQVGDTVSSLANAAGITVDHLRTSNCLEDDQLLSAGQEIYLPIQVPTSPTLTPTTQPALAQPTNQPVNTPVPPADNNTPTPTEDNNETPPSEDDTENGGDDGEEEDNSGEDPPDSNDSDSGGGDEDQPEDHTEDEDDS